MNSVISLAAFSTGALIGLGILHIIAKPHREERVTISKAAAQEVVTINRAAAVIVDRMHRGVYAGKTIEEIHEMFEFEQIAQRESTAPNIFEG